MSGPIGSRRPVGLPVDDVLAEVLRPGQDIVIGQGHGAPRHLITALPRHLDRLRGSRLLVGLVPQDFPDLPGVDIVTFFPSGPLGTADGLTARNARYLRRSLYDLAVGLRDGIIPVDVALAQATPPTRCGCSLGLTVDFASPAIDRAGAVVLEVLSEMPWTGPRSTVALDDRIHLVAGAAVPLTTPERQASGASLGHHLIKWVPDGATIELGMGRWTQEVTPHLARRRQLRVHTGMISNWLLPLLRSEALDPAAPVTATAVGGSHDLYRVLSEISCNLDVVPAYVTHHPDTLASLPLFRAINSALEVDLLGAANSEIARDGRLGGIGGLADFARGASHNPDGLSILVLSSTAAAGSRIVPRLGADRLSLPAAATDVVVTEHGSADLRKRSPAERADALISVAAPEHRAALQRAARELEIL